MFALAVAGLALIAVSTVTGDYARNLLGLQERTWAHWTAMNKIVEIQLEEQWPATGSRDGTETDAMFPVYWVRDIKETPYERVRKIEVKVYLDKGDEEPITRLTTYTGKESTW